MPTRDAIVASSPVILGSGEHHVLAVHGWFGSASGWGSPPEYLDGSAYTYVFMDLRGYGDRMKVSGQFTMAEAAAESWVLADELGWERFSRPTAKAAGTARGGLWRCGLREARCGPGRRPGHPDLIAGPG